MSFVRRIVRMSAVAIAGVLVLGAVGAGVVQTAWFKDWLRGYAVERAAGFLNGELAIGHLGGSLFTGVELQNVSLTQPDGEAFRADAVTVRYDPLRIWRDGLAFDVVEIRAARVRVVQEPDGGWNLARLIRTRGPSGGNASFRIGAFDVTGADVTIDPIATEPRHLSDLDVEGGLVYERGSLSLTIDALTGRDDRTGFIMDAFTGSFADGFRPVDVRFAGHAEVTRLSGRVTGAGAASARTLDAVVDVERLDLARMLEQPRFASDITGRLDVKVVLPDEASTRPVTAFRFRGPAASAFGYAGEDVDISGAFSGGQVTFAGGVRAYGARVTIDAAWEFSTPSGARTGFTGSGTFVDANLRRLPPQWQIPQFDSRLAGRFDLRMTSAGWTANATLGPSMFEDAVLGRGTTGRVEFGDGSVRYQAKGDVAQLDVQRLSEPLELPLLAEARFEGRLTGTFQAEGEHAVGRRVLVADTALRDSTLGGTTFSEMALHVELDGPRLLIGARGGFDGLTGRLAGWPDTMPIDLRGTTDATVVLHDVGAPVTLQSVDVAGEVLLASSTVRGIEIESASLTGNLTSGMLTVAQASVHGPSIQATATGVAAMGESGESAMNVSLLSEDLRPIGEMLGRPLSGAAEFVAEVAGPASHPHAHGTLHARSLAYGEIATALTIATSFDAEMPGRDIAALVAKTKTDGAFVKAGGFEFIRAGLTADYTRNEVVVDSTFEEQARTLGLSGVVRIDAGARRVMLRRFEMATAEAVWSMPEGREARVELGADRVTIAGLVVGRGRQQISIGGSLPFDTATDDAVLDVDISEVQLADVNQLMLGTRRVEGVANGEVAVRGTFKSPAVEAKLAIVEGSVEGVPFDGMRADLKYAGGLMNLDTSLDQAPGARMTIAGVVPVTAPATATASMNIKVTSDPISLGLLQAFTPELSAVSGTGTFDVAVTGTFEAPVVDGTMNIDEGAFSVTGTGVDYRSMSARLQFVRNRLEIDDFSILDESGQSLRVAGGVSLATAGATRDFDITVVADSFAVLDNALGTVRVDAILLARGDFTAPRISGEVRIDQGRIEVDRVLEITTSDLYSTTPLDPADAREPPPAATSVAEAAEAVGEVTAVSAPSGSLFSRVDLDLNVGLPGNLVLRGRDLRASGSSMGLGDMNIVAGGDLRIRKAAGASAEVLGSLEIVRGYYSFQGRRFEVRPESTVRFRGQAPVDPALDVTADREISGVTASVVVGGSMRDPDISLSSQPPLDDADLLSLIVFGAPVNDLGQAQRASLSERAATMAAGAITTPIADSVARALNLDLFEIQSTAGESSAVSFGNQIGTRLYIGVRQQVGRSDASTLSFEYRVAEFLRVVTSFVRGAVDAHALRRREQSGADLIFLWRY